MRNNVLRHRLLWLPLAALALAGCRADGAPLPDEPGASSARGTIGLMSTLPIYWPESAEFGDILKEDSEPGWVRRTLETGHALEPLDTIDAAALEELDLLVLAQPRALSAAENVALDTWVRGGGRVLVFADPMLTRHSRFAIGDRRRPQDVILLSPILGRWGLELTFDARQEQGERSAATPLGAVPVNLAGRFRAAETDAPSDCTLEAEGLIARCAVGAGSAVLMADAAILDGEGDPDIGARREALAALLEIALPE